MIRVACPHCQRSYRTQTEGMGKLAVCTGCHETFTIGEVRLPFNWNQADAGLDSWVGVPAPVEKKEFRNCIICEAPLDEDAVRCPECGANQATGVVHPRQVSPADVRPPIWSRLPIKLIAVVLVLAGLGFGVYAVVQSLSESTMQSAQRAACLRTAREAAALIEDGAGYDTVAARFAGTVDNEKLPLFLDMLSASRPDIREAARMLIACGSFTDLQTVVAFTGDADNGAEVAGLWEAIGARRLVELSGHEDVETRRAAAQTLCLLCALDVTDENVELLADPVEYAEKLARLNNLCRSWPELVGRFGVQIGEEQWSRFVQIEQVGWTFYMQVGSLEFRSIPRRDRTFEIPLEAWCVATGSPGDVGGVGRLLGGTVMLTSPAGADWGGLITCRLKRELVPPLPGFLPIEPPPWGQTARAEIRLIPAR